VKYTPNTKNETKNEQETTVFGCGHGGGHFSPLDLSGLLGAFYTYFYNHAHRPRLEKLLYIELSRSFQRIF
jgi:hypothetical protein